jgi:glycosyltransferase involved in cell wall biosynthesis
MLPRFDSVVMLTWSNWKTEPRSNRYHYATRFARHVPVLFVQPDGAQPCEEPSDNANIALLHVGSRYGARQLAPVSVALERRGLSRPLLWSYNPFYRDLARYFPRSMRIHHATEDYFMLQHYQLPADLATRCRGLYHRRKLQYRLILALRDADLVVCVTPGVANAIRRSCGPDTPVLVLQNGCDYAFWSKRVGPAARGRGRVAVYQGGINERLDAQLLADVMRRLPSWEFRFCGPISRSFDAWKAVSGQPNYRYLGMLAPEALADELQQADVGLIAFVDHPALSEQSLPLKAFEYAASGLPVVSTPIRALSDYPAVFRFARSAAEFAAAMLDAASRRHDPAELEVRLAAARAQDYDRRFDELLAALAPLERRAASINVGSLARAAGLAVASLWNGALALAGKLSY